MKDSMVIVRYTKYMENIWNMQNIRRILNVLCYCAAPIVLIVLSLAVAQKETFQLFGKAAEILLLAILFVKPIAVLTGSRMLTKTLAFRRQLGVAIFWLALFHSIGFLYLYDLTQISLYLDPTYYLLYGAVAMIGMAILGVTSNDRSVKYFRRNWMKLQYLAYPTLFFTLLHSSMVEGKMYEFYILAGSYAVLKYFEWQKRRK